MDNELWMARAKEVIRTSIQPGAQFEVKQLFPLHEWDALSRGERSTFGRYFASCVADGGIENVVRCENGKNRHNCYVKRPGGDT